MGIGFRSFIFADDGSLWRLPEQLGSALAVGQTRLPELANQTWRVASVLLETDGGKPVGVVQITGTLWHFDERGGAQRNLARGAIEALGLHRWSGGEKAVSAGRNVVDISLQLRRRRWWGEHRWEPTPAEITRMINAIWPKAAGRNVEPLQSIKTSWKRRKPVSRQAGWVVDRCREHVYEIQREQRELSEPDLLGVITKLNEDGGDTVIDAALWGGVAEACKQEIERRKARRRRKGRWYAVADRIEWLGHDRAYGPGSMLEYVATDSKDAAEQAGRDLIRKYADLFSERTAVKVDIYPEIEWQPPD